MNIKGYVFGWHAPTYVDASRFERAAQLAGGYDRAYVCDYHAKNYLARVRSQARLGAHELSESRLFLRKLKREGTVFRYAVVREFPHAEPVEERVVLVFKLGSETGVEYVYPRFLVDLHRLERELNDVLHHVCTASVSARMARRITEMGAVPLRKGGGAYFVPAALPQVMEYVESVICALDGSVMKFGVTGLDFELDTIFEAFRDSFQLAVHTLRQRAIQAKQQKTVERVTNEFSELMQIAEVYRDILQKYQGDLDQIIDTAKRGILSAVSIPEKPQPAPTLFETEELVLK